MHTRNRIQTVFALAMAVFMTLAGSALASDVDVAVVDVTVPTNSVTLTPGGSGSIAINMSVTGNQAGTATFEVYRNWTLSGGSFVGSNPQEFTVNPRAGGAPATTFSTSGTVTAAASQAAGTFTLAVGAFDITNSNETGGKLAAGDRSNYQVTVSAPAVVAPTVSYTLTPATANGDNGWYKTGPVTLTWNVTGTSPTLTGCVDQNIAVDQDKTAYGCTATNSAGTDNESVEIGLDTTPPTNVAFSNGPLDGGLYFPTSVPAAPTCSAQDATSGVPAVAGCTVTGYSTGVGTHTLTATATDNAGNVSTATRTYRVRLLTLQGFFQPVDMGAVNTVKGGSTVPLKFRVFDEGVEQTATSVVASFTTKAVQCDGSLPEDAVEIVSTGGTSLRYDATGQQFIQNWQTPKQAGKCFAATAKFVDGESLSALFKLK